MNELEAKLERLEQENERLREAATQFMLRAEEYWQEDYDALKAALEESSDE